MKKRILSLIASGMLMLSAVGCNANLSVNGKEIFNFNDTQIEQPVQPEEKQYDYQQEKEYKYEQEDEIIKEKGMIQVTDTGAIQDFVVQVIDENPKAVEDFKNGKTNVVGWLMGQVMKKSGGKANPAVATELLKTELAKR